MTCLLEFARSILSFPRAWLPRARNPASSPLFPTGQPSWMPTLHLNSLFRDSSRARPRENDKFRTHPALLSPDGPCYSPAMVLLQGRQSDEGVGQGLGAVEVVAERGGGIEHRRHHLESWQRNPILIGSFSH